MKTVIKVVLGVLVLLLAGLGVLMVVGMVVLPDGSEQAVVTETAEPTNPLAEEAPIKELDVGMAAGDEGTLTFDITLDDFIASYNGYYWQEEGARYLLAASEWTQEQLERTVQSTEPATRYSYRVDEDTWTLPQLRVTVPEDSELVEEVTVCYDEHSFSSATYALFEEDCFYTLKTFFSDLDDAQLTEIVETVNQSAYDHTFLSSQQYRPGTAQLPVLLYHRDGIGVFGYFAVGAPVHFCIIPVDETLLADYAASGVDVREIG